MKQKGQIVEIKVITVENKNKMNISMKALVNKEKKEENQ